MKLLLLLITAHMLLCNGQYTSQTYPDPRNDPLNCRMTMPGPLCDPNGIIPQSERAELAAKINQLVAEAAPVVNTSPFCETNPDKKLEIIVAVIDKIGVIPTMPADIEKFTNSLKARYQNFKDVSTCDNTIVIVNAKTDRQVYTVAGRDVKLTKDILKNAFLDNIQHFKDGQYAIGLYGMVEFLINAYKVVHGPDALSFNLKTVSTPEEAPLVESGGQNSEGETGVDQETNVSQQEEISSTKENNNSYENKVEKPEDGSDQLWVEVMKQAVGRCGNKPDKMTTYVRAIIDEAMSLSLRLISDPRYTQIEEGIQNAEKMEEAKSRIWQEAKEEFIDDLYKKYSDYIRSGIVDNRCPIKLQDFRLMKKY